MTVLYKTVNPAFPSKNSGSGIEIKKYNHCAI